METKNFEQSIFINADIQKVYLFFSNAKKHSLLTDAESEIDFRVGGKFEFFGGAINGVIKEIIQNKKIVFDWFCFVNGWEDGHISTVELIFEEDKNKNGTTIKLLHKNIPCKAYDLVVDGWNDYYWNAFKKMFKE